MCLHRLLSSVAGGVRHKRICFRPVLSKSGSMSLHHSVLVVSSLLITLKVTGRLFGWGSQAAVGLSWSLHSAAICLLAYTAAQMNAARLRLTMPYSG